MDELVAFEWATGYCSPLFLFHTGGGWVEDPLDTPPRPLDFDAWSEPPVRTSFSFEAAGGREFIVEEGAELAEAPIASEMLANLL